MVASTCPITDKPVSPKKRKKRASSHPDCLACAERAKPRRTMPMSHAVETVRGIFLDRLDELCADWLATDGERFGLTRDEWIELFGSLALKFFPEEIGRDDQYTPDPNARMKERPELVWEMVTVIVDGQPVVKRMAEWKLMPVKPLSGGLVPRRPTTAIYARHLEAGKKSSVAKMTTTAKDKLGNEVTVALFTPDDLARLGERQERRAMACGI